jgi:peptidoglycan/xylan/chitin deacetylase (PgdA/CDA1 family)
LTATKPFKEKIFSYGFGNIINRLMKLLISCIFLAAHRMITQILSFRKERRSETLVVLTYHSVRKDQRLKFARQMDELTRIGQAISSDFSYALKNAKYYIAVTFDDGFQNILSNALPEMLQRNIPATIFVTTGYLGEKPAWIIDKHNPNMNELLLTEDQLKRMPRNLVTIGSHTDSHPHLHNVNMDTLKREITVSKKKLEEILLKTVTVLSLPYGSLNKEKVECFKEAGYSHIFLNVPTFLAKNSDYIIGRVDVSPEDWMIEYGLKLRGAYQWLPFAITVKSYIIRLVSFNFLRKVYERIS